VGYTDEQLNAAGVDAGQVRISIGVEDAADLIEDVGRALDAAG
jgi:O-acetylhomoserine/O-acetylserine sulfhydrylase-like pyridoxal-dependent enzyme